MSSAASSGSTPCRRCGTELAALAAGGRLGCPDCYRHHRGEMAVILERYHGSDAHVGLMPTAASPEVLQRREAARTRSLLDLAVGREDYEEAARLRDRINELTTTRAGEAEA